MDNNGNDREFFGNAQENLGIDLQPERQIVTARGTGDGLVIRADGRVDPDTLRDAFEEYVRSRKRFLAGNHVSIEWIGQAPDSLLAEQLIAFAEKMDIEISSATVKENRKLQAVSTPSSSPAFAGTSSAAPTGAAFSGAPIAPVSVKSGMEVVRDIPLSSGAQNAFPQSSFPQGILGGMDAGAWDEADCRVIASTVRGGQKIETEHSLVIFGDVNSGAELIAGGDIIVLGTLRGVAHAGAYDETGGGRVVFSLNMQASQLRIGSVISRGAQAVNSKPETSKLAEIARVDGGQIVVEPYLAKAMLQRRRD